MREQGGRQYIDKKEGICDGMGWDDRKKVGGE
jgi:hypothetical protein